VKLRCEAGNGGDGGHGWATVVFAAVPSGSERDPARLDYRPDADAELSGWTG
jgi:hypothetical protein